MKKAEEVLRNLVVAVDGYLEYQWPNRQDLLYLRLLEAMSLTKQEPSYWYVGNEEAIDKAVNRAQEQPDS